MVKETDYYSEAFKRAKETPAGKPRPEAEKATWLKNFIEKVTQAAKEKEEREAKILFNRANSTEPRERRQFRIEVNNTKQPTVALDDAKEHLRVAWAAAELSGIPPVDIITDPDKIKHSAVAAEMAARIAALPPELRKNPEIVYKKVAEAYTGINWGSLTVEQEGELRETLENSLTYIRERAKEEKFPAPPKDNEQLWRGLNDFYLTANIPDDVPVPPDGQTGHSEAVTQNASRRLLRRRLAELQQTLGREPPDANMKRYLNDAWRDLNEGYIVETLENKRMVRRRRAYIREDTEPIMAKLREEANQWESRGGAGRSAILEEVPAAVQYEDWIKKLESQTAGRGLLDEVIEPGKLDAMFSKPEHAALKARLGVVQTWLRFEGPDGIAAQGTRSFESAQRVIRGMLNDRSLEPNQIKFLEEGILRPIEAQLLRIKQENQPMSRFYLTLAEREGLISAPIATIDHIFDSLIDQIIRDPEGPRARAAMERLQLMQEYLFSDEFDVAKLRGISAESQIELERVRHEFRQRSAKQRENLGRSFTIRMHVAQFFEAWSNADSPANPEFQRFLNSRMNEDDFFGLDGLYGNLVARARERIRINYEKLIFDNKGIKQGYSPELWDKAVKQAFEEMKANESYQKIYNDNYLSGKLFKERPFDANEPAELGPSIMGEPSVALTEEEKKLPQAVREKIEQEKKLAHKTWEDLEKERRKNMYQDACSTIVSLANIRMIMSVEKYNMDIRFRPIKWAVAAGKAPSTFLEKAKLAKLMRPWEAHMMTWGSFSARPAFEKAQLRHSAAVMKDALPRNNFGAWVDDWTSDMWGNIERFKSGTMQDEDQIKAMFADLEVIYFFTPDQEKAPTAGDLDFIRKPETGLTEKEKAKRARWKRWLDELSKDKLRKEIEIYAALQQDQQHTMRPYGMMFESGYRRESETSFLKQLEQEVKGALGGQAEGVFLAAKVVGAADSYFMKIYTRESDPEKFLQAMSEASQYRPHSMALAMKEGGSKTLDTWAQSHVGGKDNFMEAYKEHATSFEEIRSRLLGVDKQIKYDTGYAGLTPNQLQVAREFFLSRNPTSEKADQEMKKYFDTMQSLSQALIGGPGKHGMIQEFTNVRYAQLLSKGRWDDYPYELLQYPERAVPSKDIKIPIRVSDRFKGGQAGEEQSGPWRRMWRDFGGAQLVFDQLPAMFDPDPKIRLKAINTAYVTENNYQGPTHAAINYLMRSGGRLGAEKLRPSIGPIPTGPFLAERPGNSDAWEYYDGDFRGRTVEELKHELDEDMRASSGKIVNAPEAAGILDAVESNLGISNWRKILLGGYDNNSPLAKFIETAARATGRDPEVALHQAHKVVEYFNDHWPSGIQRQKLVVIAGWATLAVLAASLVQAQEQIKEDSKGHR